MAIYNSVIPKHDLKELSYDDVIQTQIHEIIEDFQYQDQLSANGLSPRKKILLHGPPGCGKTSLAHALAKHLEIPLMVVNGHEVVESHMGQSEKNAGRIIEYVALNRCLMLVDEFDSLATQRDSGADGSADKANNRIVNTILTGLDNPISGVIIGCTNLFEALDPAVVRRFDVIIEIPKASASVLKEIAQNIIKDRFGITAESILREAFTPSDVVRVATQKLRRAIIDSEKKKVMDMNSQLSLVSPEILEKAMGTKRGKS